MSIPATQIPDTSPRLDAPANPGTEERTLRVPGRRALVASLAVLATAVYANALSNGFAIDDVPIIRDNPNIHNLGNLRSLLLGPYWPDALELYRPVVLLSFAVDWLVAGGDAWWFHLVNVVLHSVVTVLVFLLVERLGGSRVAAAAGAAVFAIHPVHVEAVANIVGRAEILATLFFLLACHLHLTKSAPALPRIGAIAICYLLALGSKEIAVSLPAVLVTLDLFRARGSASRAWNVVRAEAGLLVTLALTLFGYLGIRAYVLGGVAGSAAVSYLDGISTSERLATAVRLWPEIARLLFWPKDLAWEWGPAAIPVATWTHPMVWVGSMLGISAAVLTVVAWNRERWISLAILWFALTFLVVSQIPFPIGVMLAERHLYLPSVALSLLAPAVVGWLRTQSRSSRTALAVATLVLLTLGAWRSWTRTPTWKSTETAYLTLGREHPESYRAAWFAGGRLLDQGRPHDAIPLLRRAVDLTSRRFYSLNLDYTRALLAAGRYASADSILLQSIRFAPQASRAYLVLAESHIDQDRFRAAIELLRRGRASAVDSAQFRAAFAHHLAVAYDGLGQYDSALVIRRSSMQSGENPPLYQEWYHLARLHELLGQPVLAAAALDSARVAAPAEIRSSLTLDPVPPLDSPLIRGWTDRAR